MVRSERQRLHHDHHYESSNYSNHHVLVYNDTYRDVISTTCSSNYSPLEKMKMMMNSSSPRDHSLCITESSTIPSAVIHLVMSSKVTQELTSILNFRYLLMLLTVLNASSISGYFRIHQDCDHVWSLYLCRSSNYSYLTHHIFYLSLCNQSLHHHISLSDQ